MASNDIRIVEFLKGFGKRPYPIVVRTEGDLGKVFEDFLPDAVKEKKPVWNLTWLCEDELARWSCSRVSNPSMWLRDVLKACFARDDVRIRAMNDGRKCEIRVSRPDGWY